MAIAAETLGAANTFAKRIAAPQRVLSGFAGPASKALNKEVWFDMESLAGWTPYPADPNPLSEETELVRYGDKGMRMTYANADTLASKTFAAKNLKNKIVIISIYISDITKLPLTRFYLQVSGSWSNHLVAVIAADNPYNRVFKSGWNYIALNNAMFDAGGTATRDDFDKITGFRITLTSGGGEGLFVIVDSVFLVDEPNIVAPAITITFDDGYATDHTVASRIMSRYGFRGTSYVITDAVGIAGRLTLDQLRALYDMGWDISNHTASHLYSNEVSEEDWVASMEAGYDWLVDNGFGRTACHLSYPGGQNTRSIERMVAKHHKTGRLNKRFSTGNESIPASNMYALQCINGADTLTTVKNAITLAANYGQWLILMFHEVSDSSGTSGVCTVAHFTEVIEHIAATSGVQVLTMSEMTG